MKTPEFRTVKTRKEHKCIHCNEVIEKGVLADYMSFKAPRFKDEIQVGIEYVRMYLHYDNSCNINQP